MPNWTLRIKFVRETVIEVTSDRLLHLYGEDDEDAAYAYYFDSSEDYGRPDEQFDEVCVEEM